MKQKQIKYTKVHLSNYPLDKDQHHAILLNNDLDRFFILAYGHDPVLLDNNKMSKSDNYVLFYTFNEPENIKIKQFKTAEKALIYFLTEYKKYLLKNLKLIDKYNID